MKNSGRLEEIWPLHGRINAKQEFFYGSRQC